MSEGQVCCFARVLISEVYLHIFSGGRQAPKTALSWEAPEVRTRILFYA